MADKPVTYSKTVPNGTLPDPAGVTLAAADNAVIAKAMPELTILRYVSTAGAATTLAVKAGDMPPALAAGLGDLTVNVPATGTVFVGPFESGRFLQNDGSLVVTAGAGAAGSITALKVARNT
jgi:hypothetical protein